MEGKLFLGKYLICVILVLFGQLHGCSSCIEEERKALLELKKYIISKTSVSGLDYVLPSWNNDDTKSECCGWAGITCNRTSSRVIELSIGFTSLKETSLLNLSLLHPFEEVRSLDLSSGPFSGFFDDVQGHRSLSRLQKLEVLDLSSNSFNNSILPFLNAATSLTSLNLQGNVFMKGPFPFKEIKDLTNLEFLKLSRNGLNGLGSTPLKMLKTLDLSFNAFSSIMELQVICEMKNLEELDLSFSLVRGQLPLCLGNLNKLRVLDFSNNKLSGNLPSSFNSLESLEYLSLSDNNFTGLVSLEPLANLTKLKVLKLSSTSNMLQVETETHWEPRFQLSVVVLRVCNLEKIPPFLVYQKNLRLVDLSSNRLSGSIPTWLLANNPGLEVLHLQNNAFTLFQMPTTIVHNLLQYLDFSANDISGLFPDNIGHALPNLVRLNGSSNAFQGPFPSSMGEMVNITLLDLSYNNFSGELPRSFLTGCVSLRDLKLSHNKLSGHFLPRGTSFTSLENLRMDSNLFSGKMEVGLLSSNTTLSVLDMSKNRLTGAIPSWISNFSRLTYIMMTNNFLQGTIPPTLPAMSYLSFLDLSGNLLSGALPSHVGGEFNTQVFLHDNNFTGPIPNTLLDSVQILDVRNNKLSGSIPKFVHTETLYILLLRGNNLTGSIPRQLCELRRVKLLDLSGNKLSGSIPSCLYNLSFGREGETEGVIGTAFSVTIELKFYKSTLVVENFVTESSSFQEVEIKFATKQRYDSYFGASQQNMLQNTNEGGMLYYMYGMDLSRNELSGAIPGDLGDLTKLRVMNLSHNLLSSSIPSSFSNLKDIESLDLSHNMLYGSIPYQLTSLTSLAVFNVSYNNLSGTIPQGKQFDTFDRSSYLGNPLLCGPPTYRICGAKETYNGGEEKEEDEAAIDMVVFYFTSASVYATVLIGILALMCFDCPWRRAWLHIVDAFITLAERMFS